MKFKAAVLAALIGMSAAPAQAQPRWADGPYYPRYQQYEGLPLRVIMRSVRMQGLMPVGRPMRHENVYIVRARDQLDRPRIVLVDARSARIVGVQAGRPMAGPGPSYAMRPPRAVPAEPGLPPGAQPGDEMDHGLAAVPPPRRLPPPPPRGEGAAPPAGEGVLPAPPSEQATAPARATAPRTAAVSPAHPPVPRPRPAGVEHAPPAAMPSKPKGLPRVVLPGGPLPKSQRTAETRPGQREHNDTLPERAPEKPAEPKPSEAPAAAPSASEIPPAQTFE